MTRPIYEPSLPRQDAYLDFQQQQLFRRPAPVSAATAVAWARFQRINDSDITVLNQTNTVVGGTSGEDINTDTSIFQINSSAEIEMLVDGLIGIWAATIWSTYNTTFRQVSVFDVTPSPDVVMIMGGSSNDLYDPVVISGIVRVTTGAKLKLIVNQHSGGGQTIYGGGTDPDEINFLEVQYLGTFQ